jgi:hypothetical protein
MAGGGKVRIADRDNFGQLARVVDGRLLVSGDGGGGGGGDVNIAEVGGNVIGATVPISGTVAVSALPTPVPVSQSGVWNVGISPQPVQVISLDFDVFVNRGKVEDSQGTFAAPGRQLAVRADGDAFDPSVSANAGLALSLPLANLREIDGGPSYTGSAKTLYTDPAGNLCVTTFVEGRARSARRVLDIVNESESFDSGPFDAAEVRGAMISAVAHDDPTSETPLADLNFAFLRTDLNRRLWVNVGNGDLNSVGTVGAVNSVIPGTGATNLGKAEDAAHTSGATGVMALAVRQNVLAALAGTTGDYIPLSTDNLNRLDVMKRGGKRTYRAATLTYLQTGGATNAMFFVISGSSTQVVTVQRVRATGFTTVGGEYGEVVCEKWSTAPSGGTATALTQVSLDSNNAAPTVNLCQVYTAPPTEGTLVGTIGVRRDMFQPIAVNVASPLMCDLEWDFRNEGENHGVVLRGTAQCLSLAAGTLPSSAFLVSVEVEWTEE